MTNIYNKLNLALKIKNSRVRTLGVWVLHAFGKRYLNIYFDPVLGCNLRCQMCYFSDEEVARTMTGRFSLDDCRQIAAGLFPRAMKLQIGCGAEPTLFRELPELVKVAKYQGVPFISLVTNGNLLTLETLRACAENGLSELTISCHGFNKETYEMLMEKAHYEKFLDVLGFVHEIKKDHPGFVLRINFTVNNDNYKCLKDIWNVVSKDDLDVLQIRPVQNLGSSKYKDFDLSGIKKEYDSCIKPVVDECNRLGIRCLYPSRDNLDTLTDIDEETEDFNPLAAFAYCNINPRQCWKDDYDFHHDSFGSYSGKHHLGWKIFRHIFRHPSMEKRYATTAMNYSSK